MAETTYKKGELQDYEGNQLLPKTKAALVETGDGSNVEEKLKTFLLLGGGTMTGPAVGAAGELGVAQFRNIQYGTEPLIPGESPLPQGTLYITPEAGVGSGVEIIDVSDAISGLNKSNYKLFACGDLRILIMLKDYVPVISKPIAPKSFDFDSRSISINISEIHRPKSTASSTVAMRKQSDGVICWSFIQVKTNGDLSSEVTFFNNTDSEVKTSIVAYNPAIVTWRI